MSDTNQAAIMHENLTRNIKGVVSDGGTVNLVDIQTAYMSGFAGLQVLGNLGETCRSGKERARAALERIGVKLAPQRLVMGFSPADVKIDGAQMDLPMAVGLALASTGVDPARSSASSTGPRGCSGPVVFAAEVGLGGELRPVQGIVAFALAAAWGGAKVFVVSSDSLPELAGVDLSPLEVLGGRDLEAVLSWLRGDDGTLQPLSATTASQALKASNLPDFSAMMLPPEMVKVAVAVAAGGHNLLMRGTPGSGKTMFAQRLPGIMPVLDGRPRLRCMQLHSLAGSHLDGLRAGAVPFRSPHHGASMAAVMGSNRQPGEISLAHGGILFLDELPEFRRDLLEALREPLESGEVHVARVGGRVVWPANAVLVAACNNCPCGWTGSRFRMCRCLTGKALAYRARLSGPLLDRIDIHVNLPEAGDIRSRTARQGDAAVGAERVQVSSAVLAGRVAAARSFAGARRANLGIEADTLNARLDPGRIQVACGWGPGGEGRGLACLLDSAASDRQIPHLPDVVRSISSRGLDRALRVARTLADMDMAEVVGYEHLRQALLWQAEAAARQRGEHLQVGSWRSS